MSFLNAEWRKLAIANYVIDPQLLEPHLPFGTELDLWEGKCYVSLVSFMFLNTKLLGVKIPFHRNFEEANLRFYVKRKENGEWKRGVVFIKEIVPKPMLTLVANSVYNENYETLDMKHEWNENEANRSVKYQWEKDGKWQTIKVNAELNLSEIGEGSETEFITEHYWGYARVSDTKSNEYEVCHPRWGKYTVLDYEIDVDYELVYGKEFGFLNDCEPSSVMLAEGSVISVESKKVIKA